MPMNDGEYPTPRGLVFDPDDPDAQAWCCSWLERFGAPRRLWPSALAQLAGAEPKRLGWELERIVVRLRREDPEGWPALEAEDQDRFLEMDGNPFHRDQNRFR